MGKVWPLSPDNHTPCENIIRLISTLATHLTESDKHLCLQEICPALRPNFDMTNNSSVNNDKQA